MKIIAKKKFYECKKLHKKMWDFLYHNPTCCEVASRAPMSCEYCPIFWNIKDKNCTCSCASSPFNIWKNKSINPMDRNEAAKQVRDAKWLSYASWRKLMETHLAKLEKKI